MGKQLFTAFSAFLITAFNATLVLAAEVEDLSEHAEAGGHGESGGLPQLDPTWYASQIFWLVLTFGALYFIFAKKVLPNLSSTLESRREHIQNDLTTAEELQKEAERVSEEYETMLNDARNKAVKLYEDIDSDIKEKSAAEYAEFQTRLAKETKMAEAKINTAKKEAMDNMNTIVAEVAKDAAEKIVGMKADLTQVENMVKDLAEKPKAA